MTRSIHTTRRDLAELEATDFGRPGRREAALARAHGRLARKRRIKAAVRDERQRPARGITPATAVPVLVTESGAHVHHGATVEDVREVLRRLPPGVLDGLGRVLLQVGADYQVEYERTDPGVGELDPLIGRLGWEEFPGVWSARVLGTYHADGAVVRVNARVYEATAPLRAVWEVLLKLDALSTLVHEVGHHYDHTMRVARGRWLAHGTERVEIYAEDRQHAWMQAAVIPYLRQAYPEEVARIEQWVAHHGGVALSFEQLAGDPRGTRKGGAINLNATIWSMGVLVKDLIGDVIRGEPLSSCRVGFARFLHYRDDYAEALRSLDMVLSDDPGHLEALTLRADILVHQERYTEALDIARGVLGCAAEHADAWEVVADACEALERWSEAYAAASRLVELHVTNRSPLFWALLQRGRMAVRLGRLDDAWADLAALERDAPGRTGRTRLRELRAELEAAGATPAANVNTSGT